MLCKERLIQGCFMRRFLHEILSTQEPAPIFICHAVMYPHWTSAQLPEATPTCWCLPYILSRNFSLKFHNAPRLDMPTISMSLIMPRPAWSQQSNWSRAMYSNCFGRYVGDANLIFQLNGEQVGTEVIKSSSILILLSLIDPHWLNFQGVNTPSNATLRFKRLAVAKSLQDIQTNLLSWGMGKVSWIVAWANHKGKKNLPSKSGQSTVKKCWIMDSWM